MSSDLQDFAAFILTNGRPDRVKTYETLRRSGYTGRIVLVVDDLDKTKDEYIARYGDEVVIFDKRAIAQTFDQGDNFGDMRAIIYARNASFEIAKRLGIRYFIQLDDDYVSFYFRFTEKLEYTQKNIHCLDTVFAALLRFFVNSGCDTVAMAQGGDYLGGPERAFCFWDGESSKVGLHRKCMNSFICSTDRPFQFVGRINEDVNTYTRQASTGLLMFTTNQVSLNQLMTQSNSGGMTELYLDSGTYVKSFYSVMYHPSSVSVRVMRCSNARLHHQVSWKHTTPKILRESLKKAA